MQATVTVDNGKVFRVDMDGHVVTLMDERGRPVTTRPVQRVPDVTPGEPFICAGSDGLVTMEGHVVHVMYYR